MTGISLFGRWIWANIKKLVQNKAPSLQSNGLTMLIFLSLSFLCLVALTEPLNSGKSPPKMYVFRSSQFLRMFNCLKASFNFVGMRTVLDAAIEALVIEGSQLAVVGRKNLFIFIIDITSNGLSFLHSVNYSHLSSRLAVLEPFEMIVSEPGPGHPPICALARTVHFFNGGLSVMVGFLDTKEMFVARWLIG